ncbi:site-specific integrase [Sinorhizobium sp. BJ1]|uniref:site-specific integrase n=1 Tax=Sinorhizobium sp. BJ1 TaxID=2035455 RepID=UPI001FE1F548|nr:site-specific integrase [Sinorhizobium sp. BJ1]
MRDERGLTPSTVEQWGRIAGRFLLWCEQSNHRLKDLKAEDIDNYIAIQGAGRWGRVSIAHIVSALRGFLRYAAKEAWCSDRLATSTSRPRLYRQETLPYAPDWSDVQKMLADVAPRHPRPRDPNVAGGVWYAARRSSRVAARPKSTGRGERFGFSA